MSNTLPIGDRTQRLFEQRRNHRRERDQISFISAFHASRVVESFDDWREEFDREANRTYAILWGGYGKLSEKILQDCLGAEVHGQCQTFLDSYKPEQIRTCKQCGKEFNNPRGRGYNRKFCATECGNRFVRESRKLSYWLNPDYRDRLRRKAREKYTQKKLQATTL